MFRDGRAERLQGRRAHLRISQVDNCDLIRIIVEGYSLSVGGIFVEVPAALSADLADSLADEGHLAGSLGHPHSGTPGLLLFVQLIDSPADSQRYGIHPVHRGAAHRHPGAGSHLYGSFPAAQVHRDLHIELSALDSFYNRCRYQSALSKGGDTHEECCRQSIKSIQVSHSIDTESSGNSSL